MDKLVKTLPLIGAIIVFFGFLKLQFYYSYFGIDIIFYLDFSEIITLFLNDITAIVTSFALMLGYVLIVVKPVKYSMSFLSLVFNKMLDISAYITVKIFVKDKAKGEELLKEFKESSANDKDEPFKLEGKIKIMVEVSIAVLLCSYVLWLFNSYHFKEIYDSSSLWSMNILGALAVLTLFPLVLFRSAINTSVNKDRANSRVGLISLIAIVLFFVFNLAKRDHYTILNSTNNVELELVDGRKVCTDSEFKFIGKTRGFYFFSDINSKENMIIPIGQVINFRSVGKIDCYCDCSDF